MNLFQSITQTVPDSVKVVTSVTAPALALFGVTLEEWTLLLSGLVSILFIIEKFPMFLLRMRAFKRWLKSLDNKKEADE